MHDEMICTINVNLYMYRVKTKSIVEAGSEYGAKVIGKGYTVGVSTGSYITATIPRSVTMSMILDGERFCKVEWLLCMATPYKDGVTWT